jgi:hypothetical protein
MRGHRLASLLAGFIALLGVGLLAASPAAAATSGTDIMRPTGTCKVWFDDHTYGASCAGGPYKAVAYCDTGWPWLTPVYGAATSNWGWSYAYCSSVQGTLAYGEVQFF